MDISPGLILTWRIAGYEAIQTKHQYVEIEHIFIGLCKISDELSPDVMEKMGLELNIEEIQKEIDILNGVFRDFGLNSKSLIPKIRGMLKQGKYEHAEKVIHRSQKCKELFKKAEDIASSYGANKSFLLYLFLAILKEPSEL
ncbi:MAG: Clp protease N-terminal domain-containing protein [bacterium]